MVRRRKTTSPEDFTNKTEKGEAKIAVRQADKKRLVFLLGFVGEQRNNKKTANLRFWLHYGFL